MFIKNANGSFSRCRQLITIAFVMLLSTVTVGCDGGSEIVDPPPPTGPGTGVRNVEIRGTGALGRSALKIEVPPGHSFNARAGQFLVPLDSRYQRMMLTRGYSLGEGSHYLDAACMQQKKDTPTTAAQFRPSLSSPSSSVEICQSRCNGDQSCIWACEKDEPGDGTSTLRYQIEDGCNDSTRIDYRFFDQDNDLVWPNASQHYYTPGYGQSSTTSLSCRTGASICYGGRSGDRYWGVGLDGRQRCESCCVRCSDETRSVRLVCR